MKIGILSINLYTRWLNLACPLHSYAMQEFLKQHGYDCKIIDYTPSYYNNFDLRHPSNAYQREYEKRLTSYPSDPNSTLLWYDQLAQLKENAANFGLLYKEREGRHDKFQDFIKKYLNVTETHYDSDRMELEDPGFDCYMCVTDVIWKVYPNLERAYFLANKCMDNKIKIAYSASRNHSNSSAESKSKENLFFRYLSDFDAISVREQSLKEYIEQNSDIKAELVLDPVMLHDRSFYEKIAVKPKQTGYMFLYHVVDAEEDNIEQAAKFAKAHNLKIIEGSDRPYPKGRIEGKYDVEHEWIYDMSIEEWLGYIMYADCVFTNSFHCCCLSALFGKSFFAGSRNGDKVDNILSLLGLEERRFNSETDYSRYDPDPIDYDKVQIALQKYRKQSEDYILNALKNTKAHKKPPFDYDEQRRNIKYHIYYNLNLPNSGENRQQRLDNSATFCPSFPQKYTNDGSASIAFDKVDILGYMFKGWHVRFKIDNAQYWLADDGSYIPVTDAVDDTRIKLFKQGDTIPHISVNRISRITAEAVWQKTHPISFIAYHSGINGMFLNCGYSSELGRIVTTAAGACEYAPRETIFNNGEAVLPENKFILHDKFKHLFRFKGWKLRYRSIGNWYWYTSDGSKIPVGDKITKERQDKIVLFQSGDRVPVIDADLVSHIIAVAQWEKIGSYFTLCYHSGISAYELSCDYNKELYKLKITNRNCYELTLNDLVLNIADAKFPENRFYPKEHVESIVSFAGWNLRCKIDNKWYWYMNNGTLSLVDNKSKSGASIKLFAPGDSMPKIDRYFTDAVMVANWEHKVQLFNLLYHSGLSKTKIDCNYDNRLGKLKTTNMGCYELILPDKAANNGSVVFPECHFSLKPESATKLVFAGWNLRFCVNDKWYWYRSNGKITKDRVWHFNKPVNKLFMPGEHLPVINKENISHVCLVAQWDNK